MTGDMVVCERGANGVYGGVLMGEGNADGVSDVRGEEEPDEEHGVRGDDGVA